MQNTALSDGVHYGRKSYTSIYPSHTHNVKLILSCYLKAFPGCFLVERFLNVTLVVGMFLGTVERTLVCIVQ